ncbi:unnamed protein product [Closterium sp. NIES-65]|nr:unnamed protein product [Closterium sp. NIES-65]
MKRATNDLKVLLSLWGVASNVVQIEEAYGDKKALFIVMELCAAGDLASHIKRKGPMSEDAAREVFLSAVLAVKQCHEHGVIHGNVAPDHVLLRQSPSAVLHRASCSVPLSHTSPFIAPPGVPIGPLLSRRLAKASTLASTPSPGMPCLASASDSGASLRAVAAALLGHGVPRHHDIWGLGLVLRAMLSGHVSRWPQQELRRSGLGLDGVSEQARELIQRLMDDDVTKRPTVDDILKDPWVVGEEQSEEEEGERGVAEPKCNVIIRLPND